MESFKKNLVNFSKESKDITFAVRCTNYVDDNIYYLKNGLFASGETFNTKHAFANQKVRLSKLKNDGIYKATKIEPTERNKNLYNL